ncbi:MAG: hypothetical protein FWG87_14955 [Defluviitaleaceae bacterium]|nr:hypothetical protein [Defluviitaleaceae bacterium]
MKASTGKRNTVKYFVFILLAVCFLAVLSVGGWDYVKRVRVLGSISRVIEVEDLDSLTLSVYYISPFTLTHSRNSAEDLISHRIWCSDDYFCKDHRLIVRDDQIVAQGDRLEESINALRKIDISALKTVIRIKTRPDVRLCYVFETGEGERLLTVAYDTFGEKVFVNGIRVKDGNIFSDVIRPLLSEEEAEILDVYLYR